MAQKEIFPKGLSVPPLKNEQGQVLWKEELNPIDAKLLQKEATKNELLREALSTDLTSQFFSSLHHKATHNPPEDIRIEIKGSTRSGKSTVGIFLGKLLSYYWGHEFTVDNILANQGELLEKAESANRGETFLVDEQTQEMVGEGVIREVEQLGMILNICAKHCLNLIFIYPPSFTTRGAPYGLETLSKDMHNKYVKCFYHDLKRKAFGYAGIWPMGYVWIPKYVDEEYQRLPMEKWSEARVKNFREKHYDFDSLLEENYEIKKDKWIDEIRKREANYRMKAKEDIAVSLSKDEHFLNLKNNGQKEAYVLIKINRGDIPDVSRGEIKTIVDMAMVMVELDKEVFDGN